MFRRSVKVLLIGAPRVGKTALHTALAAAGTGGSQRPAPAANGTYVPTEGVNYQCSITDGVKLHLWDLGGHLRVRSLTMPYFNGAHALFVVYDATTAPLAEKTLGKLHADWLARPELLRSRPSLVYVVGVDHGKTCRADPDSALETAFLNDTVHGLYRDFGSSARVVVPLRVRPHDGFGVQSLATRVAQDASLLAAGTSHEGSALAARGGNGPGTRLVRTHRARQVVAGASALCKPSCRRCCIM